MTQGAVQDIRDRGLHDQRYLDALTPWRTCMVAAGYRDDRPGSAAAQALSQSYKAGQLDLAALAEPATSPRLTPRASSGPGSCRSSTRPPGRTKSASTGVFDPTVGSVRRDRAP